MATRLIRQARRFSYGPPRGAAARDNSTTMRLLGMAALVGGMAYVYYDPDVLPASVKKWLPIQEPKGHGMSLEEYEQWKARQAGLTPKEKKSKAKKTEKASTDNEDAAAPPGLDDKLLVPRGDVSKEEMKTSLEKLLAEARENQSAFLADLKKGKQAMDEEERQLWQGFEDEKARLKKELKFIKKSK